MVKNALEGGVQLGEGYRKVLGLVKLNFVIFPFENGTDITIISVYQIYL